MDNFVQNKLREWNLSSWVDKFKEEEITKESLFFLDNQDIAELFPRICERLRFKMGLDQLKKEQNTNQETDDFSAQVLPSTSPKEERILVEVKRIMENVKDHLNDNEQLGALLINKINNLETDKRELIGVFGKTGAGKSSLINAIINEKNLLPTGILSACTSVMIKVEANTRSSKYEADIEFITKEEWRKEFLSYKTLKKGDDDYREMAKKLTALYGKEWENKSTEFLMDEKNFQNIPKFSKKSEKKPLECNTAQELSEELSKYTKDGPNHEDGNTAQQWCWPLVKCVTVRVPNNDLLRHVTVVDLPGNGDRNKSRGEMWKQVVGDCSTVWIVAEIKRAVSEIEPWEILKNAYGLIGNGGQCQRIHFICTNSDPSDDRDKINKKAKEAVNDEFQELNISKHFSEDGFKVYTVSAKEFLEDSCVKQDDNEIPKLQDFLKILNKCHSETFIYVSGAYGILSLIEGARHGEQGVEKADDVCKALKKNMNEQLDQVETAVEEAIKAFDQCLREGVENSKTSEEKLKSFLDRDKERSFFSTLQSVVKKDGTHKTGKGEQIDLNTMLASCLTDSIDEKFRKTFPNDVKGGSFNGVISKFSLDTKSLIQTYEDVKLQLIFLQTEEDKNKTQVNEIILKEKKIVYNSLTETIEKNMTRCYEDAKKIEGDGALKNMRKTIEKHVYSNKQMYEEAKNTMLKKMNNMKKTILEKLEKTMKESIEHSLKTNAYSLPDVSDQLGEVKKHYDELKGSQDEEMSQQ